MCFAGRGPILALRSDKMLLFIPPREKSAGPFLVSLKLRVIPIFGFEHRNTRDLEQQKRYGKRTDDAPQAML